MLGVLGVLLVMVVVYVLTSNTVTERKSDAAAASAEADQLEARAGAQTGYTDFAQIADHADRVRGRAWPPPASTGSGSCASSRS